KAGDALVTLPLGGPTGRVSGLDVAVVIDTTGSMGDEIRYLESELVTTAAAIRESYPGVSQRWAYVAYRDYVDAASYVTRAFPFADDVAAFGASFATLGAGGGGDYPEAPERGLAEMNRLAWREGAVARVAFWVGDAPHHPEHAADIVTDLAEARDAGIHLYP